MPGTRYRKSKPDEGERNSELIQIITWNINELKQDLITRVNQIFNSVRSNCFTEK